MDMLVSQKINQHPKILCPHFINSPYFTDKLERVASLTGSICWLQRYYLLKERGLLLFTQGLLLGKIALAISKEAQ